MLVAAGWTGCATQGPNHLYAITTAGRPIVDMSTAEQAQTTVASHTLGTDLVCGLAYESFLDHLFVRLAPGDVIREIERPSGRLFRQYVIKDIPRFAADAIPTPDGLAVRSRDRHLFLTLPGEDREIAEVNRECRLVRRIPLGLTHGRIAGLAFDQVHDRLLILYAQPAAVIAVVSLDGREEKLISLAESVRPVGLGYDSDREEFFIPLADGKTVGTFDREGKLLARQPVAEAGALDAGPRSAIRVF